MYAKLCGAIFTLPQQPTFVYIYCGSPAISIAYYCVGLVPTICKPGIFARTIWPFYWQVAHNRFYFQALNSNWGHCRLEIKSAGIFPVSCGFILLIYTYSRSSPRIAVLNDCDFFQHYPRITYIGCSFYNDYTWRYCHRIKRFLIKICAFLITQGHKFKLFFCIWSVNGWL